jgi:hypothetical protein
MRDTSGVRWLLLPVGGSEVVMRRLIDIDYRRAAGAFTPWETLRSLATSATCVLLVFVAVLSPRAVAADVIPVRFVEGAMHGFLVLRTFGGALLASGDLLQIRRDGGEVESRMVFRFEDGSLFDETVVYTQQGVFALQSYSVVQRGPAFPEDTDVWMERASGKYRVTTRSRADGREDVREGTLDLPPDVYNGMILTVAKSLPAGGAARVHLVAFTPTPRVIELQIEPAGEHDVIVGVLKKTAIHYVFKPKLGTGLSLFARLTGRMPPDCHVWIVPDDVPAFVRFDGPLFTPGPAWRIELTSPRWPDEPE